MRMWWKYIVRRYDKSSGSTGMWNFLLSITIVTEGRYYMSTMGVVDL
jgi:hypothetical protein